MATASRSPLTAARAATCDTLPTFDVECDCRLVAAAMTSVGPDHPAHPPAGHGVGLGHAVHDDARVGQLGHERRHRGELVVAVGEVLVDLVGDHPDAVLDRPPADGLDLVGRVDGAARVVGRHEQQHLRAGACGPPRAARRVTRNPVDSSVSITDRHATGEGRSPRGTSSSTAPARAPRRPGRSSTANVL